MKSEKVIKQIARERNLTPKEVKAAMRSAIRDAMSTQDPEAQKLWKQIAPDGKEPSIDRFLEFCVDSLNQTRDR